MNQRERSALALRHASVGTRAADSTDLAGPHRGGVCFFPGQFIPLQSEDPPSPNPITPTELHPESLKFTPGLLSPSTNPLSWMGVFTPCRPLSTRPSWMTCTRRAAEHVSAFDEELPRLTPSTCELTVLSSTRPQPAQRGRDTYLEKA